MTLWDEVGGRTWTERAGPHSTVTDADTRPGRRRAARRFRRALPPPVAPSAACGATGMHAGHVRASSTRSTSVW